MVQTISFLSLVNTPLARNEEEELRRYEEEVLQEAERERLWQDPVLHWMHAVRFQSCSRGRGRKASRYPREVTLLQYGSDYRKGRWRYWSGEDRDDHGRNPWDEWVTEIFGDTLCERMSQNGTHSCDYLREQVERLLREFRGRF